jgi:hypothetical protein
MSFWVFILCVFTCENAGLKVENIKTKNSEKIPVGA